WTNAPSSRLRAEIAPHAEFAVFQAMCSPRLEVLQTRAVSLGGDTWRVEVGIANTGWLPTHISEKARKDRLVLPLVAELSGAPVVGGPARLELGQLAGRLAQRFAYGKHDGTPERVLATWIVSAPAGTSVQVAISHERAGRCATTVTLVPS
ncbi:MAG: hypothetical protein RJB65_367, partial [Actinomycetota bacterium]